MDSKEASRRRQAIAWRDMALMQDPSRWPLWPFLPLRRERQDDWPEIGLLFDAQGKTGESGWQTTVFRVGLYDLGDTITNTAHLLEAPHVTYDSFAAMCGDGWEVD